MECLVAAAIRRAIGAFVFVKHEHEAVAALGTVIDLVVEVDFPDPGCQLVIGKGRRGEVLWVLASKVPHLFDGIPGAFPIRIALSAEDGPLAVPVGIGGEVIGKSQRIDWRRCRSRRCGRYRFDTEETRRNRNESK